MSFRNSNRSAFTLIEIMLAVAIMAMTVLCIYRFLILNLTAISLSSADSKDEAQISGFFHAMQTDLNTIPGGESNAILGQSHMFGNLSQDNLQLLCRTGNGLFTQFATDSYQVTLMLQQDAGKDTYTLGLQRIAVSDLNLQNPPVNWLPLISGVQALEIRYFDGNLKSWVDKWTSSNTLPALVRIRFWKNPALPPREVTMSVPQAAAATLFSGGVSAGGVSGGGANRNGGGRNNGNANGGRNSNGGRPPNTGGRGR